MTLTKKQIEEWREGWWQLTDKAREEIARLALIGLAVQPRPIEEAPKDGTHILAFFDDNGVTPPTTLHWFGPPDLPGLRGGGWYFSVQDISSDRRYYPKRFIPLTSLPEPKI